MKEECKHKRIIRTEKETYCEECGLVFLPEMIGNTIEYDDQKNKYYKREPTPFTYYDDGIGTVMPVEGYTDAKGNKLTLSQRQLVYRLRRASKLNPKMKYIHISAHTRGYKEIEKMASKFGTTPQIRDTAVMLFKMAHKKGCMRGRRLEASAAACVWLAYRRHERVPPTTEHITKATIKEIDVSELNRSIKIIKRKLGLKYDAIPVESYITCFANQLNINAETKNQAIIICKRYVECKKTKQEEMIKVYNRYLCNINSKRPQKKIDIYIPQSSPTAIAAASIYMAICKAPSKEITQEMICEVAGITEVTLRNQKNWLTASEKIMT